MHTSEELVVPGGDDVTGPLIRGVAVGVAVGVVVGVVVGGGVAAGMVEVVPAAAGRLCPPKSSL